MGIPDIKIPDSRLRSRFPIADPRETQSGLTRDFACVAVFLAGKIPTLAKRRGGVRNLAPLREVFRLSPNTPGGASATAILGGEVSTGRLEYPERERLERRTGPGLWEPVHSPGRF